MSDTTAVLVFLACLLSTFGLVYACDRLNPDRAKSSGAPKGDRP